MVSKEDEISIKVDIHLKDPDKEVSRSSNHAHFPGFVPGFWRRKLFTFFVFQNIVLCLEDRDGDELILVLSGYYKLLTDRDLEVIREKNQFSQQNGEFALLSLLALSNLWKINGPSVGKQGRKPCLKTVACTLS